MVQRINGPALQPFAGNAQPQHVLDGPGEDKYKMIDGTDRTYLVSTGVYDCAILTVVLPAEQARGVIGTHRVPRSRAMAHFNKFSGPKLDGLKTMFVSVLYGHDAQENDLVVNISHHTGARFGHAVALADLVGQAVPGLASLTLHTYGPPPPNPRAKLAPVAIYLTPDGQVRGSA